MFELNKSVNDWRRRLLTTGYCSRLELEELEEHLRQEVKTLESMSLSTEEAFIIASRRLGEPEEISREFGKVDLGSFWRSRLLWIVTGVLLYTLGSSLCVAMYQASSTLSALAGLTGYGAGISGIIISATCLTILAMATYKLAFHEGFTDCILNRSANKKKRNAFFVAIVAATIFIPATHEVLTVITVKVLPIAEFAKVSIVYSVASLGLSILLPLAFAVWLLNELAVKRRLT